MIVNISFAFLVNTYFFSRLGGASFSREPCLQGCSIAPQVSSTFINLVVAFAANFEWEIPGRYNLGIPIIHAVKIDTKAIELDSAKGKGVEAYLRNQGSLSLGSK